MSENHLSSHQMNRCAVLFPTVAYELTQLERNMEVVVLMPYVSDTGTDMVVKHIMLAWG